MASWEVGLERGTREKKGWAVKAYADGLHFGRSFRDDILLLLRKEVVER